MISPGIIELDVRDYRFRFLLGGRVRSFRILFPKDDTEYRHISWCLLVLSYAKVQ